MFNRVTVSCLVCLSWIASVRAAPLNGVDADREEARIEKEYHRVKSLDPYLEGIVARLVKAGQESPAMVIRTRAVNSEIPFVFCLGNGAMYVSTGLVARLQSDSQLAALLAPELASVLAPNDSIVNPLDKNTSAKTAGRLLAIIATGGLAVFPMNSADNKAADGYRDAVILDNDKTGLGWVRAAGFDVAQAPNATRRLKELLGAETRTGGNRLANSVGLDRRTLQLTSALEQLPAATQPVAFIADTPEPLRGFTHRLTLAIAYDDMQSGRRESVLPQLDRLDQEDGPRADVACMRARYIRQQTTQVSQEVIDAYKKCTSMPDAPSDYFKDLAFMFRDKGDAAEAIHAFERYLAAAPSAVDVPIVKGYIEELREKH